MRLSDLGYTAVLVAVVYSGPVYPGDRLGEFALPRADLTPGVARHISAAALCGSYRILDTTLPFAKAVFDGYQIPLAERPSYVIDMLIPPELGGTNEQKNLWPQLTVGPFNHGDKVALQERLRAMVCEGEIELETAQRALRRNWTDAYVKYLGSYP